MKKSLIVISLIFSIFLTGCSSYDQEDIISDLSKKIEDINAYTLSGEMEIINNEDSYKYDVNVAFLKDDNFRVSLLNTSNNHEQIILKNSDGVYVLTHKSLTFY